VDPSTGLALLGMGLAVVLAAAFRAITRPGLSPAPPTTTIASAPDGSRVRIVGVVEGSTTEPLSRRLKAPFSGTPCLAYQVRVETKGTRIPVVEERSPLEAVVVRDKTGRATVRSSQVELTLALRTEAESGLARPVSTRLEAYLERHGVSSRGLLLPEAFCFREGLVLPGMRVVVTGIARWEDDPEGGVQADAEGTGYRAAVRARRLTIVGPVTITQEPAVREDEDATRS
jgi:hypothetical protein